MELLVLVVIVVLVIAYVDAPKKNKLPVTTYSRTLRKK